MAIARAVLQPATSQTHSGRDGAASATAALQPPATAALQPLATAAAVSRTPAAVRKVASTPPETVIAAPPDPSLVIDMHNVVVRRGAREILHASWQVRTGERWVVLGANGAGKTTLLKLAAARDHPTSGTVKLLGEQLGRVDVFELRPRIGFASAALGEFIPPDEKVQDVVLTAAYGVTGRWREAYDELDLSRARVLLSQFGVADLGERTYGTLSTGEQKRVAMARAMMTDPELLLLDEPSAGLDLAAREVLLQTLSKLAADPAAPVLVVVTHDVETIPVGFTHVLLLRDGQVVAAGLIDKTLTAANITKTFGIPINITAFGGRYFARAK